MQCGSQSAKFLPCFRKRVVSILDRMTAPALNPPLQIHKVALKVSILHKSNILSEKTAKFEKAGLIQAQN